MKQRWRFLYHNLIVHPICGVLWFTGVGVSFADRWHAESFPT